MAENKTAPGRANPSAEAAPPGPTPAPASVFHVDAVVCDRCGKGEMYRMHAVWRCPVCGFKTDCCGW